MSSADKATWSRSTLLAAVLAAGLNAPAVLAAGWYAGAGVGQAEYDGLSDEGTSAKLFLGYSFNANAAVEFAYVDTGEGEQDTVFGDLTASTDGFEVSLVGSLPVNNSVSFLGRLGLYNWDLETELGGASASDSGTDLTYGLGVQFELGKSAALRGEYQIYDIDGDDIDNIGISVLFRF